MELTLVVSEVDGTGGMVSVCVVELEGIVGGRTAGVIPPWFTEPHAGGLSNINIKQNAHDNDLC